MTIVMIVTRDLAISSNRHAPLGTPRQGLYIIPYLTEDWVPVDVEAVAAFCCGLCFFLQQQQHTTMIMMIISSSPTPQATPMMIYNRLLSSLSSWPELATPLGSRVVDFVVVVGVVVVGVVVVVVGLVVVGLVVVVVVGGAVVVVVVVEVVVVTISCKKV